MNRTGIEPNKALDLYNKIDQNKNINLKGFHVYDGNIRDESEIIRKEMSDENFQPVISLLKTINQKNQKNWFNSWWISYFFASFIQKKCFS